MRIPALVIPAGLHLFAAAHGQDATGPRFRAGMEALAAAQAAADRDARDGRLDEAIAAFRAILVDHPELVRVRLELAHAFFLKEEDSLARRHFEQVLAGTPPPAVAANIRRFLDIMRARRRWEAHFGLAAAPDSNLNAASGERTVFLDTPFGRLSSARLPAARRIPGAGLRPQHHRPQAAQGQDAGPLALGAQPRLHPGRLLQPPLLARPRGARYQRPSPRLHAKPRRTLLRATVPRPAASRKLGPLP